MRFDGDTAAHNVVGGNQYNYIYTAVGTTGTVRARPVDADDLREVRATFVAPAGAPGADALADRGLLVLRGPARTGKTALAIWLLHKHSEAVYQLDDDTRLDRIAEGDLTGSTGYLLATLSESQASTLTGFVANRLDTVLRTAGARLVIAVRSDVPIPDRDLDRFLMDTGTRPPTNLVLDRHLRWHLGDTRAHLADDLLSRPDIRALLTEELHDDDTLADVARVAKQLATAADDPVNAATIVRQRLDAQNEDRFRDWFEGIGEVYPMCLAIALAVCQGLPYEAVADAAMSLHRVYRRGPDTAAASADPKPDVTNPFGVTRDSRLHKLRADVNREDVTTQYGPMTADVVRYRDGRFPQRVLEHVWCQHDKARAGMLTWLRELGGHPEEAVRAQAANVVGSLTTVAFQHLRHTVLESWAHSENPRQNESAAVALWPAIAHANPSLPQAARALVSEWSYGPPNAQVTAAHAYGTALGPSCPEEALTALGRLAEPANYVVLEAVLQNLTYLAGPEGAPTPVLRQLVDWTRDRQRHPLANFAFLRMAADLVGMPDDAERSTLPWLSEDTWLHPELITTLWASVLNSAEAAAPALTVLDRWAASAEPDPAARTALAAMLSTACVHPRVTTRLRQRASEWTKPRASVEAPRTAQRLLALLPEKGRS